MIENFLNEFRTIRWLVKLRDDEHVIGFMMILLIFRMDIVGNLTVTVNGVLVVTTKENINRYTGCPRQSLPTSGVTKAFDCSTEERSN